VDFIGKWQLEDISVCDDLIDFFNNDSWAKKKKGPGVRFAVSPGKSKLQAVIDRKRKASTDLSVPMEKFDLPIIERYGLQVNGVLNKYYEKFPWASQFGTVGMLESFNIQHYKPSEGYFQWHTERCGGDPPATLRYLVFMTYLNDVEDGGETEFFHQKLKVKPKKGLTLIWPSDWTHLHRGVTSPTQEKYIATGWFHLIPSGYS